MPVVSIWMIRLSLSFLFITFVTGSVMLLNKAFGWSPALWALLPIHLEVALLGWVLQFVMGTAYWMFPRYLRGPKRGNIRMARMMVIILNSGILLSAFSIGNTWVLFIGRFLLLTGVGFFVALMWRRVVSYRRG